MRGWLRALRHGSSDDTIARRMIGAILGGQEENFAAISRGLSYLSTSPAPSARAGCDRRVLLAVCTGPRRASPIRISRITHEALKIVTAVYVLTGPGGRGRGGAPRGVEATREQSAHRTRSRRAFVRPPSRRSVVGDELVDGGGARVSLGATRRLFAGVFSSGIVTHLPRGGRGSRGSRSHSDRRP